MEVTVLSISVLRAVHPNAKSDIWEQALRDSGVFVPLPTDTSIQSIQLMIRLRDLFNLLVRLEEDLSDTIHSDAFRAIHGLPPAIQRSLFAFFLGLIFFIGYGLAYWVMILFCGALSCVGLVYVFRGDHKRRIQVKELKEAQEQCRLDLIAAVNDLSAENFLFCFQGRLILCQPRRDELVNALHLAQRGCEDGPIVVASTALREFDAHVDQIRQRFYSDHRTIEYVAL